MGDDGSIGSGTASAVTETFDNDDSSQWILHRRRLIN
jgi:hypothetical protein